MSVESSSVTSAPLKRMSTGSIFKGAFKMLPLAGTIGFPIMTYMDSMEEGKGFAHSASKAGAEVAMWSVMPGIMLGKDMIGMGSQLIEAGVIAGRNNRAEMSRNYSANFGGNYVDSQMAGTMRQAGMYNMQQSKSNVQSRLGGEAKSFYRRNM